MKSKSNLLELGPKLISSNERDVFRSRIKCELPADMERQNMARELLAAFKRHSGRTLIVDAQSGRQWTGARLLDVCGRIASSLIKRLQMRANDVVLMFCDHTDYEIILALAIILAGGALYGSTPADGYEEERTLCEIVRPNVIVANSRLHNYIARLKREVDGLESASAIWIDNPTNCERPLSNGYLRGEEEREEVIYKKMDQNNNDNNASYFKQLMKRDQVTLLEELARGPLDLQLLERVAEELIKPAQHVLTYMLTSGSTGRPKVVPTMHREHMNSLYSMLSACRNPIGSAPNCSAGADLNGNDINLADRNNGDPINAPPAPRRMLMPFSEDTVFAGDLPLDHGAGVDMIFFSLHCGSKLIIMPSYEVSDFWKYVSQFGVTSSVASTTFAYKLMVELKRLIDELGARELTRRLRLDQFTYIACCGAKMAFIELVREIQKTFPRLNVCQAYGATEIGFMSMLSLQDSRDYLHSVGHLFPGLIGKIVDPKTGQNLPTGERGELHVWSRSKFNGYRCLPSDDSQKMLLACHDSEGFYRTGDQAHFDADQRLYIHGRFKDTLYLAEDWKILPAELEELIDRHPLVAFSAVVGIPDPDLAGCDAPRAFVKLIEPQQLDDDPADCKSCRLEANLKSLLLAADLDSIAHDIYQFVARQTAKPKHLKGGVRILNEFPRVGLLNKIDRKALKVMD